MDHLPVYTLDLETRLKVDSIAFNDENFEKSDFEIKAFSEFQTNLEQEFKCTENKLKDENHSIELLKLERDITAIMVLINRIQSHLSFSAVTDIPYNSDIEKNFTIYDMALRYRYALGLYDTDESFSSYYDRKTAEFISYKLKFQPNYKLPSLVFPYDTIPDDSKRCYTDELIHRLNELSNNNERFTIVNDQIQAQLSRIKLPTKYDWSVFTPKWKLGYMEQQAIQAEVIMHFKNELRNSILYKADWVQQTCIDALYIMYHHNLVSSNIDIDFNLADLPNLDYIDANFIHTGILGSSIPGIADHYATDIRMLGTRGHGIAAEHANHIIDKGLLKDAQILGDDNVKNGADRLVDNSYIQTKYCKTGGKSVGECFENGKFRYIQDGKPMQIEVPKDQYESAIQSMQERIKRGEMRNAGITDPNDAEKIIKKGHVTYKTAQRIAKAGTIEGITYDAAQGAILGATAFGISAVLSFSQSIWRGEDTDEALNNALKDGSSIFGKQMIQYIATKQIGRTAVERSLRPTTDYVVKNVLGSKTSAQIVNTFFRTAGQSQIHGAAAMNQLSKLMRGNMVAMAISTVILSSGSILDVINGKISGSQLFKNIGATSGGVGGAAIGATLGSAVPVVGTFIGGMIGGFIGGALSKKALDAVIDDDAVHTIEILKGQFMENIEGLQLDRDELNFIAGKVFSPKELPNHLKSIYAASNSSEYIEDWLDPYINAVLKARPHIGPIDSMVYSQQQFALTTSVTVQS
ncbi:hypothetical protein PDN14_28275 [Bacillus cereus group sp. Bc222]|uniref:hypothetical protein n=1 Tax=Bacillus TaxID=1386 RepID=UPI0003471B32|nr:MULTISPECIES: hypothetical protein [Bacillus cereus group]MCC2419765.1 hypothetical protein [Bacillus pacificus]MCU5008973.1 hypothetical protein [Bacillus pacificus]MCU5259590.1 hypothetical protein [Bacillus pacificus]MCU5562429.1 hypothetical protein [Bacillus pacificus]MDA2242264.1 hypothetical protein [Bacillus cereus group sp. Bc222]